MQRVAGPPDPLVVGYVCGRCGRPLPEGLRQGEMTIQLKCEFCGTRHRPKVR
jgi:DNA-directed RNA polymerase subunit RPC12/RpoP